MALTEEEVKRIAELARLGLSKEEITKFSGQLTDILDYVDLLNEVDTKDVELTAQVTGLENVTEADEVVPYVEDKAALLKCSPLEVEAQQILVKSVF